MPQIRQKKRGLFSPIRNSLVFQTNLRARLGGPEEGILAAHARRAEVSARGANNVLTQIWQKKGGLLVYLTKSPLQQQLQQHFILTPSPHHNVARTYVLVPMTQAEPTHQPPSQTACAPYLQDTPRTVQHHPRKPADIYISHSSGTPPQDPQPCKTTQPPHHGQTLQVQRDNAHSNNT